MEKVCLNKSTFTFVGIFCFMVIIYCVYMTYKLNKLNLKKYKKNKLAESFHPLRSSEPNVLIDASAVLEAIPNNKFYRRLNDPLQPPERTYPLQNTIVDPLSVLGCGRRYRSCNNMINIPTQNTIQSFQQVGLLYQANSQVYGEKMFPLFGRKLYTNSDKWEYYAIISNNIESGVKVPLEVKNNQELMSNDEISIPGMNGVFKTTIYDTDFPKYV